MELPTVRHAKSSAFVLLSAVLVASCSDTAPPVISHNPSAAQSDVLDGTSGGNAHFFFWSPLVQNPGKGTGAFNPNLWPTVEICVGASQTNGHCNTLLVSYTKANALAVTQDGVDSVYQANWDARNYQLTNGATYRVVVLLGDHEIGHLDLTRDATGNLYDSGGREIRGNGTVPIKFRIEKGVICGDNVDCLETTLGGGGGTFTTTDSTAGAEFPAGAVDHPVNFIIQEITTGECLPTDLQQFHGCFHFSTEPHVDNFADSVTVGVCLTDPAGAGFLNDHQLRLWKWSETEGDPMLELERTTVTFLSCPDLNTVGYRGSSPLLKGLARAGNLLLSPIAALLGPNTAYAIGSYEGGKLSNFSRIGWVRPVKLDMVQGNNQATYPGYALPVNPTVRVTNKYGGTTQPVAGVSVSFASAPSGSAAPAAVASDVNGLAATVWTLGSALGNYTLTASVNTSLPIAPAPYEPAPVVFNAQAVDLIKIRWQPPLMSGSTVTGTFVGGLAPVLKITQGAAVLATLNAVEGSGQYQANWNIPTPLAATTIHIDVSVLGESRGFIDLVVNSNGDLRNVATGEKVLNLKNNRSLPVKFIVYR
jgi:hypothetical protein